jgi:glyoxylate utilization-related uncharacterized protein
MAQAQLITRKVGSEQTGGAYSLFEVAVAHGGGSRPHIQHREDECFYVLEGRFEFVVEGARSRPAQARWSTSPRATCTPSRTQATRPAGCWRARRRWVYEGFVEEVGEPATGEVVPPAVEEVPDAERLIIIGAEYGIEVELPSSGEAKEVIEQGHYRDV